MDRSAPAMRLIALYLAALLLANVVRAIGDPLMADDVAADAIPFQLHKYEHDQVEPLGAVGIQAGDAAAATLRSNPAAADVIANSYGLSVADLQDKLAVQRDLAVDFKNKKLMFACSGHGEDNEELPIESSPAAGDEVAVAAIATVDATDPAPSMAFLLHSRPASNNILYLDFDGYTTTSASVRGAGIVTPPYSMDSDPAFSDTEKSHIVTMWRRVAEDYSPFDVDVTTE